MARRSELQRFVSSLAEFDAPLWPSVLRMWRLLRHERFSPDEVFMLALLDPRKRASDLENYFSKEKLLRLQLQLNPACARTLTGDKVAFHRHCVDSGIPTPSIVCIVSPTAGSRDGITPCIASCAEWETLFARHPRGSIFIKPASGAHGHGVLALDLSENRYIDPSGRVWSVEKLFTHFGGYEYREWIVQERIRSHRSLSELSGTSYLQTARVVTYAGGRDPVRIIGSRLRLIGGCAISDNFNFGLSGNLIASIDAASGAIKNVVTMRPNGLGLIRVTRHPATGAQLIGFQVPRWNDVLALVERAARTFLPLRTVGWDVAITDRGVLLIEGNETWDSGFYDLDLTNEYKLLRDFSTDESAHRIR